MANKKTIIITGAAGFIGSHLVKRYLSEGHRVIGIDNLQKTHSTVNIENYLDHPNFLFKKHDIIDPLEFREKIDWVLNFACPVSCVNLQVDPVHTLKSSVHGVINMLEVARKHDAVFMQASSPDVYGVREKGEVMHEAVIGLVDQLSSRACYEEGKRVAETLCFDYRRKYYTDTKIIRIFNGYGPNMYYRDGRVISSFVSAALAGKDLTIYGDGSYTRSHLFIDDLVEGIDRVMKQPKKFSGPINLGNDNETSVIDLAETVLKMTGSKSKIVHDKELTADPKFRRPDISLARRILNWEPKVSLEEGLRRTIEHYQEIDLPEKKILVFATTFYPDTGPAEDAFMKLAEAMPDTEFHVIAVKSRRSLTDFERAENMYIHRLGEGNILGKYLFPWRAARKARELSKNHSYRFVWSIMASYGGLAALLFKRRQKDVIFILTFDKTEMNKQGFLHNTIFRPIYRKIFKAAEAIYANDDTAAVKAREFEPKKNPDKLNKENAELVKQVQEKYTSLLNQQEGVLARPK